ncbi:MAG TPA: hypothetical protein VL358_00645 [Caulobacteraceae bacterium]|jgi:hypothetical protein|nr:hypothetical protein [Caulobacteraceae bacterium]
MNLIRAAAVLGGLALASVGAAWGQAPTAPSAAVGAYQLTPRLVLRITQDDGRFHAQLTHQPVFEITPDGMGGFTTAAQIGATFTFVGDGEGAVTGAVLHQHGRDIPARRIDEALAKSIEAGPVPRTWPMLATSAPRLLTHEGVNYWPCFSPDGKTVLFARRDDGKDWSLFRVSSAGGDAQPFTKEPLAVSRGSPGSGRPDGLRWVESGRSHLPAMEPPHSARRPALHTDATRERLLRVFRCPTG